MSHDPARDPLPPQAVTIRAARADEVPLILAFIRELAEYERMQHVVTATEATVRESLFGLRPCAYTLFACAGAVPVGFAVYFHNYSTFLGRPGLYLEDLYVRPAARGSGIGRALLVHLATLAVAGGCGRMEWAVLDWNESAIRFYRSLGAAPVSGWSTFRLTGRALERLAHDR